MRRSKARDYSNTKNQSTARERRGQALCSHGEAQHWLRADCEGQHVAPRAATHETNQGGTARRAMGEVKCVTRTCFWPIQKQAGKEEQRTRASLVVWWLRGRLPIQRTWVRRLVREDPTCCRPHTRPGPRLWSPQATAREAHRQQWRSTTVQKKKKTTQIEDTKSEWSTWNQPYKTSL